MPLWEELFPWLLLSLGGGAGLWFRAHPQSPAIIRTASAKASSFASFPFPGRCAAPGPRPLSIPVPPDTESLVRPGPILISFTGSAGNKPGNDDVPSLSHFLRHSADLPVHRNIDVDFRQNRRPPFWAYLRYVHDIHIRQEPSEIFLPTSRIDEK